MRRNVELLRPTTALAAVAAAITIAGGALDVGLAPAANSARPPCTKRALEAGLRRSRMHGRVVSRSWGCARQFAYAAVIVHNVEITVLFRASGDQWRTASRLKYCKNHQVPARIYKPACETN